MVDLMLCRARLASGLVDFLAVTVSRESEAGRAGCLAGAVDVPIEPIRAPGSASHLFCPPVCAMIVP